MIRLILAALRHHRAQAVTVLVLATFAVAAAVASPWYVAGSADRAADVDLASATKSERLITVSRAVTVRDLGAAVSPVDEVGQAAAANVTIPGVSVVAGGYQTATIRVAGGTTNTTVAYRQDMCQHLTLAGRCPAAANETLLSTATAKRLDLRVGQQYAISPTFGDPQLVTLVGTYDFLDPTGDYWAGTKYIGDVGGGSAGLDPMFTALATFGGVGLQQVTVTADVRLPDAAYRGTAGADLGHTVDTAAYGLTRAGYSTDFPGRGLADRVATDQDTIRVGVPVGAAELLALCWFAFFLAGRYAARLRRTDVALLKLRGATTFRQLRLIAGQNAIPMLGGLVLGGALGFAVARLLAGAVRPQVQAQTLRASLVTAVLAAAGGLLAVLLAEWRTLRTPVAELLRGVPPRRRGWRTDLVDLIVVAVAVAAAYQARAQGTGRTAGLAPLARGLVALAVALVLARLIGLAIAGVGGSALRSGRLRFAVAALQVTRRPGMDRVFALLMVAVAVLCTTSVDWAAGSRGRTVRAGQELGAATVVNVQPVNTGRLLAAVDTADPSGRYAMAVTYQSGSGDRPAVLAVDAQRMARVMTWQSGYGHTTPAAVAALLRPGAPDPLQVTGTALTVRAHADATRTYLLVRLLNLDSGDIQQVGFGPLTTGDAAYAGPVGCATPAGCRLLSLALVGPPADTPGGYQPVAWPVTATVTAITQQGPDATVADAATLGDPRRWHSALSQAGAALDTAHGALTLDGSLPSAGPQGPAASVAYPIDATVPVPVVVAGATSRLWPFGDPTLAALGGDDLPIRIAGTAPALPVVGTVGVLVDLTTASRLDTAPLGSVKQQVWLAGDAPPDTVAKLTTAGLTVLGTDSIAARAARFAGQGPTAALRFALFAALLGVLLAAASVAVAAAGETGPRAAELSALRAQGVPAAATRAVSYGGYLGLVLAGVLGGLVTAVLIRAFVTTGLPVFVDSWTVLPVGSGLRWLPLLLSCAGALVLLGAAALVAGARLARKADPR